MVKAGGAVDEVTPTDWEVRAESEDEGMKEVVDDSTAIVAPAAGAPAEEERVATRGGTPMEVVGVGVLAGGDVADARAIDLVCT